MYRQLREDFAEIDKMTQTASKDVVDKIRARTFSILTDFLGAPQKEFTFKYEAKDGTIITVPRVTPLALLNNTGFNSQDFVVLVNDPRNPYNKCYQLNFLTNLNDNRAQNVWLNLPSERLKELTIQMIEHDFPVWFTCDFGKDIDSTTGVMDTDMYKYNKTFDVKWKMTKAQSMQQLDSIPTHAMVFLCFDKPDKTFNVENSHGSGKYKNGFLTMRLNWFHKYVFHIVVHKKLLNKSEQKALTDKDIKMLPAWDALGSVT